jgi:putative cardiolipin synthase
MLTGCVTTPPGILFPKATSAAFEAPQTTRLGARFADDASAHPGQSGFHILSAGLDGFLVRAQLIASAERTLDLQYYIFRGDETGRLLTDALVRAADRGIRIRILVDDGDTVAGDEQLFALSAHRGVAIRIFNPFRYRGHSKLRRGLEFLFNAHRLDYRMHNKLLVADNAAALVGGRNVGDEYFQVAPDGQLADDDVFVVGASVVRLSATFDDYWNSTFAIPVDALGDVSHALRRLAQHRERARAHPISIVVPSSSGGPDYVSAIATGEPLAGILAGRLPLVWAEARVICDSPDKRQVEEGARAGELMVDTVLNEARGVTTELLLTTPYFVPSPDELRVLSGLRERGLEVRILTNSLESTSDVLALAAYSNYRRSLLAEGVELHELRAKPESARGSGQPSRLTRYGHYGLHAKLIVFDRTSVFVGSMNFDERSKHINTEIGMIIASHELASSFAARFTAMTALTAAYAVSLRPTEPVDRGKLAWTVEVGGQKIELESEPSPSAWRRLEARILALLPVAREL